MADIGDLVVRLSMEVGGAKRELANISKGFKQLDSVMKNAAMGASEFGSRIDQLATNKGKLEELRTRIKETNYKTNRSIEIDKQVYYSRNQNVLKLWLNMINM